MINRILTFLFGRKDLERTGNNDYFESSTYHVSPGERARVAQLNDAVDAVEAALDKLPSETAMRANTAHYAVDTGAANAYVVALSYYSAVAYTDGMGITFKATNANTGASTLNINGLGAKLITRQDGSGLAAGDIPADKIVSVRYNSTSDNFEVHGAPAAGAGSMAAQNANAVTITGGSITGITDLAVADGGTGSSTAAGALTNLGLTSTAAEVNQLHSQGAVAADYAKLHAVTSSAAELSELHSQGAVAADFAKLHAINATADQIDKKANSEAFVTSSSGAVVSSTAFAIPGTITENTFVTVGPTGSGADNIWTALDSVPSGASWIEVRIDGSISGPDQNTEYFLKSEIYACKGDYTPGDHVPLKVYRLYNKVKYITADCANGIRIGLDSGRKIKVRWNKDTDGTLSASMYLTGYGYNP